ETAKARELDTADEQRITCNVTFVECNVGNVHRLLGSQHAGERCVGAWSNWCALAGLGECWRGVVQGNWSKGVSLPPIPGTEFGFAKPGGVLPHRLEHGLKLPVRARNNAQHLRGSRLLLKCLSKLACALLLGIEQAHVLDCNHRLVREGFSEFNLLLGERLHLGATYCQG